MEPNTEDEFAKQMSARFGDVIKRVVKVELTEGTCDQMRDLVKTVVQDYIRSEEFKKDILDYIKEDMLGEFMVEVIGEQAFIDRFSDMLVNHFKAKL